VSSERRGVVVRLVALVHAMLPNDWFSKAGETFRNTSEAISTFADEHHVQPKELLDEGVELGRRKLEGLANKEYAEAVKSFAEAEHTKLQTELK